MPIQYLYPIGAGSETAIPSLVGAATHWQAASGDDEDTSYVESPAGSLTVYRDLFDLTTGLSGGTITHVVVLIRVKKNQAPPLAGVSIRTHATTYDDSLWSTAINSYQSISYDWTVNPFTGIAWTWTEVNALEAGCRLQGSLSYYQRCTEVYVAVYTSNYVYPTDPITRVTNIIHRYNRGIFNMEQNLGSLTTEFALPVIDSGARKSYTPKESLLADIQVLLSKALSSTSDAEKRALYEQILQLNIKYEGL